MLYPWLQLPFEKITGCFWRGRMGHAFLLTGSEKSEKTVLLDKLIPFFLCNNRKSTSACGICRACQLFLQDAHPDYHFYGKEEAISIEDIRAIHDKLQQTSHQGGLRVIVLYGIEGLSLNAANALLKNLEEPPTDCLFFLVAEKLAHVIPTIRSRCIHIHIPTPSPDIAAKYSKNTAKDDDHLRLREALFWGNSQLFYQDEILKKLNTQTKETLYLLYYWVAEYCRDGLVNRTEHLWSVEEKARIDKLRSTLSVEKGLMFLDVIIDAIESLSITGINKGLLWGSLAHQWAQLRTKG